MHLTAIPTQFPWNRHCHLELHRLTRFSTPFRPAVVLQGRVLRDLPSHQGPLAQVV